MSPEKGVRLRDVGLRNEKAQSSHKVFNTDGAETDASCGEQESSVRGSISARLAREEKRRTTEKEKAESATRGAAKDSEPFRGLRLAAKNLSLIHI